MTELLEHFQIGGRGKLIRPCRNKAILVLVPMFCMGMQTEPHKRIDRYYPVSVFMETMETRKEITVMLT